MTLSGRHFLLVVDFGKATGLSFNRGVKVLGLSGQSWFLKVIT